MRQRGSKARYRNDIKMYDNNETNNRKKSYNNMANGNTNKTK